jgi:UPF0755 protein
VLLVLGLMALPFVLAGGWLAYQLRPGSNGKRVEVKVTNGMGTGDVADALAKRGVIDSALAFKLWATVTGAGPFESGTYTLHQGEGVRAATSVLNAGVPKQAQAKDLTLLLPPGLTVAQIADRVGKLPGKSAQKFLEAAQSGAITSKYQAPGEKSLEGLLAPDTYRIGVDESEQSIVQRLVTQFETVADAAGLDKAQGLTPYEALTAASLIEREYKVADDAPLISAVIRNRLQKGMPLQIDSTLCYARAQVSGTGCPPPPTDADKALDSPYNTYKYARLPPGPIGSVSSVALRAALNPANVPYLYYVVADANGKHAFATTLQEHEQNIAAARAKGLL